MGFLIKPEFARISNKVEGVLNFVAGVPATKIAKFRDASAEAAAAELQEPVAAKSPVAKGKKSEEKTVTKKANKFRKGALKAASNLPEAYAEEIAQKAETNKLSKIKQINPYNEQIKYRNEISNHLWFNHEV